MLAFGSRLLLGAFVHVYREPAIRFFCKQIEILERILANHGVHTAVCTPQERLALLAIGKEMDHHVKAVFKINNWSTYRRWVKEAKKGKQPKRAGHPPKFTLEQIALVVRLAKENFSFGFGKIVGEMKKLGVLISASLVKAILKEQGVALSPDREVSGNGTWQKFLANVDSIVACVFSQSRFTLSLAGSMPIFSYSSIMAHGAYGRELRLVDESSHLLANDCWCRQ